MTMNLDDKIVQLEILLGKAHAMLKHGAGSDLARAHMLKEIEQALGWKSEAEFIAPESR